MRSVLALATVVIPLGFASTVGAQSEDPDCPYLDDYGECTTERPFKPREPQRISISSDPPNAVVFIDGERIAQRTPITELERRLSPGRHEFRIEVKSHVARTVTREVRQFGRQSIRVELSPFPQVSVRDQGDGTSLGGTVLVDGRAVGSVPWDGALPPGRHAIRLEKEGYLPWETGTELKPAKKYVFQPKLELGLATLVIASDLEGVPTFIQRTDADDSPIVETTAPFEGQFTPGTYSVELRVEGAAPFTREAYLRRAATLQLSARLFPEDLPAHLRPVTNDWRTLMRECDGETGETGGSGGSGVLDFESRTRGEACLDLGLLSAWQLRSDDALKLAIIQSRRDSSYWLPGYEPRKALELLERACELGAGAGCENLAWYSRHGIADRPASRDDWRALYAKGCALGASNACYRRYAPQQLDASAKPDEPYREAFIIHARTAKPPGPPRFARDGYRFVTAFGGFGYEPSSDEPFYLASAGASINAGGPLSDWTFLMFAAELELTLNSYARQTAEDTDRVYAPMVSVPLTLRFGIRMGEEWPTFWFIHGGGALTWQSAPKRVLFSFDPRVSTGFMLGNWFIEGGLNWVCYAPTADSLDTERQLLPYGRLGRIFYF